MARLLTSGFELREGATGTATSPDGISNGAVETTIVRSGSASKAWTGSTGQSPAQWTLTAVVAGTDCFARSYVYVPTGGLPSAGQAVVALGSSSALAAIRIESDGTLTLWAFTGAWTQQGSASSPITLDSWGNRVELKLNLGAGSVDAVDARLNGVSFASATGLAISDAQIAFAQAGAATSTAFGGSNTAPGSAAFALYADDVAVNDGSGAAQNTWPGDGKVVLLSPISDSAVGTGWTLGTGTAIAGGTGSTAVKNKPPVGVADLTAGSDVKQIRNASSNASVSYDANLTTYTTAGIAAADTVNVLVPMVATGAPVVTSAKAGTFGISTNPAITNISLGAGGTAGAFWSGVAAGTYPTGWKWSFGTTTYAPSVTVGSSPVARITQVTSSTRIAIVCAMGMYVDYTPAVVAARPTPNVTMAPQRA